MKKTYLLISFFVLIIFLSFNIGKSDDKFMNNIQLINLSNDEILDFLNNGNGYLYIGRPDCPSCIEFEFILADVMKQQDIKIYYNNTYEARKNDESILNEIVSRLTIEYVPVVIYFENALQQKRIDNSYSKDDILNFFN